ncbi:MAG: hypothetical protein QXV06_01790 [Ignisphaera sp.]
MVIVDKSGVIRDARTEWFPEVTSHGDRFKCKKCGFEFNSHYVACLNLFSCLNDGRVTIRGGRIYVYLEAGSVVPVDVAPDDPAIGEQVMKEKPVSIKPKIIKNT